jgi:hypothetical protein
MALDKAALAEMKRLYHGNELTVAEIGVRFGISPSAVSRQARVRGWVMRSELRGFAPRRNSVPTTGKALELVVHQICSVISTKLEQMEAQMSNGELNSEDFERDAKSIGQMVGGVFKAKTTGSDGDTKKTPDASEPVPAPDELERLQREIIARFEHIQARRDAEAGSE